MYLVINYARTPITNERARRASASCFMCAVHVCIFINESVNVLTQNTFGLVHATHTEHTLTHVRTDQRSESITTRRRHRRLHKLMGCDVPTSHMYRVCCVCNAQRRVYALAYDEKTDIVGCYASLGERERVFLVFWG